MDLEIYSVALDPVTRLPQLADWTPESFHMLITS